jgi:hypothetical protein
LLAQLYVVVTSLVPTKLLGKEAIMDDFPIWLKLLVWLTIGSTILYVIGAAIYSGMVG